tara:strand:- start:5597 stop:7636 length:2040 start_codon:yes stop_codon:yes gene_type:complete
MAELPGAGKKAEEKQTKSIVGAITKLQAKFAQGEDKTASASKVEDTRKERARANLTNRLLKQIEQNTGGVSGKGKKGEDDEDGGSLGSKIMGAMLASSGLSAIGGGLGSVVGSGLKGGLSKLYAGASKAFSNPKVAKIMGPAAIAAGVALMVKDGMAALELADEWGTSKVSSVMGGVLGGTDSGIKGAFKNAGKWALIGAGIGSVVPVVGTLIGGAIGAVVGAILGWIGGERLAKAFDATGKWFQEKWEEVKLIPGKIWDGIVGALKSALGMGDKEESTEPTFIESLKGKLFDLKEFFMSIPGMSYLVDFITFPTRMLLKWTGIDQWGDASKRPEFINNIIDGAKKAFAKGSEWVNELWEKFIPEGVRKFLSGPVDYILTDILGWKSAEGEATDKGENIIKLMEGAKGWDGTKSLLIQIATDLFGQKMIDIVSAFASDPLGWTMDKLFKGWDLVKTKSVELWGDVKDAAGTGWDKTKSIFSQIIDKIIPQGLLDFAKSPIDYILKNWFGFDMSSADGGDPVTGGELQDGFTMGKQLAKQMFEYMNARKLYSWMLEDEHGGWKISQIDLEEIFASIGYEKGGRFQGKKPIMVGEAGPELLIPDTGGEVLTNQETNQIMKQNAQRTNQIMQAGTDKAATQGTNVIMPIAQPVHQPVVQAAPTPMPIPMFNDDPTIMAALRT